MGWQVENVTVLFAGNTIINPNGIFTYSGNPGVGNLVTSQTPAGTSQDNFGNQVIGLGVGAVASYDNSTGIATALAAGFIAFYAGSLAGGWTLLSSVAGDVSGNLQVNATGQLQLIGTGGVTVNGSDQTSTATGAPVTSGPNGPLATHTHFFAGHTHTV